MNSRVIITGANGFIGSNIISEMIVNDFPITALVRNRAKTDYLKK